MNAIRSLVVGLLLLGGCAVPAAQPPADPPVTPSPSLDGAPAGRPDPTAARPTADLAPDGRPARAPAPAPVPAPEPVAAVPVRDATGVPATPVATAPARLVYEALAVDIPVDSVGVATDGQMEIPEDAARAGWYRYGPGLAAPAGTTVVAAHAGSYVTPRGPLYDLPEASPGDRVVLESGDGARAVYEVVTVDQTAKTAIDWSAYFRRDGDPQLVLVTCGGEWDDTRQSYDDNVTVTARLVEGG